MPGLDGQFDLFFFFRRILIILVTVYATVVTLQSLWQWYLQLTSGGRYITLLRRYLIVHGLRLRFTSFWSDVMICLLLCVCFALLWRAHTILHDIGRILNNVR